MERLMFFKLSALGCSAQAWLNGLPMARVTPLAPQCVVPVHEAAVAGLNRVELVIESSAGPNASTGLSQIATQDMAAQVHLLLPRLGGSIDPAQARTLAQLDWAVAAHEPVMLPARQVLEAELAIRFPRWRWLDAPALQATAALSLQAHAFVSGLARDLARGQTESFMAATRLRTEELALAYQRNPESEALRLREALEQMYASKRLVWRPFSAEEFRLQPLAAGRLLECLGGDGLAALTTVPDKMGSTLALPLKLSQIEGNFYVFR
jgi:hypothetical protein